MIDPRPEFALSFSPEAVHLLRREGRDWTELGQARFDDAEMRQGLDALRRRIDTEAPRGHVLRLVIPADQILYTTLPLGPAQSPRQAVKNALDGLTPYPIGQIAFDWESAGEDLARVAAVARQTLEEAEGFALRYGFEADRFIALPDADSFSREPVFGATEHAPSPVDAPPAIVEEPAAPPLAAVTVSRIVPHVATAAVAKPVAEPVMAAPVAAAPAPEKPVVKALPKLDPERGRAVIERAKEARAHRPAVTAPPDARVQPSRPGMRRGLGGALPWAGGLLAIILLSWLFLTPDRSETVTETPAGPASQPEVVEAAIAAPVEPEPVAATPIETATVETVPPAIEASDPTVILAQHTLPAPQPTAEQPTAQPAPIAAPAQQVRRPSAATAPAGAFTADQNHPAPLAQSAQPGPAPEPAAEKAAITEALTEASRSAPPAPATAAPAPVIRNTLARSPRPVLRPATLKATSAAQAAQPQATGRFSGATLRSSARPSNAPKRGAAPAAPDSRPATPRNPQPYEQISEPEPSSKRPPAKPARPQASAAPILPASDLAGFHRLDDGFRISDAERKQINAQFATLADLPFPRRVAETLKPVRFAQARPLRKPAQDGASSNSEAVEAALRRAVDDSPPPSRASRQGNQTKAAAPAPSRGGLAHSTRPPSRNTASRPAAAQSSGAGSASIAGLSAATDAAIENALKSAANDGARPGGLALTVLNSSSNPPRRTGRDAEAPARETVAAAAPAVNAAQSAAAAEAALAERRRLDDELQAQAEARARARAAEDAAAEAGARAQAEARARAQAEAERVAAERRNQQYRPPEIDDEPEVTQPSGGGTTSTTVAGAATQKNAIDLSRATLIGVVGAGKASRGLIRLRNGRVVTVRMGDRIDGGTINAIGEGRVQYVKSGRPYELRILNGK